jgi:hypothetical protein
MFMEVIKADGLSKTFRVARRRPGLLVHFHQR